MRRSGKVTSMLRAPEKTVCAIIFQPLLINCASILIHFGPMRPTFLRLIKCVWSCHVDQSCLVESTIFMHKFL